MLFRFAKLAPRLRLLPHIFYELWVLNLQTITPTVFYWMILIYQHTLGCYPRCRIIHRCMNFVTPFLYYFKFMQYELYQWDNVIHSCLQSRRQFGLLETIVCTVGSHFTKNGRQGIIRVNSGPLTDRWQGFDHVTEGNIPLLFIHSHRNGIRKCCLIITQPRSMIFSLACPTGWHKSRQMNKTGWCYWAMNDIKFPGLCVINNELCDNMTRIIITSGHNVPLLYETQLLPSTCFMSFIHSELMISPVRQQRDRYV